MGVAAVVATNNTRCCDRHGGQGAAYARGLFFNGVHAGLNYKF